MKLIAVVMLVCLLATGTVTAVSMSVGSVQAARTVVPTAAQMTKIPGAVIPVTIATPAEYGMIEVYSNPSGASISLNGNSNPVDKTPLKYSVPPGSYTVVLSLAGYQDYTETFSLSSGDIKDINADLKLKLATDVGRANIAAVQAPGVGQTPLAPLPAGAITRIPTGLITYIPVTGITRTPVYDCNDLPMMQYPYQCMLPSDAAQTFGGQWAYYTDKPCGYVTLSNGTTLTKYCCWGPPRGQILRQAWNITAIPLATTAPPANCPNADWSCLTPEEAGQQFGYPNARFGDEPCGYAQVNDQTVAKYCYMGAPSGDSLPAGALQKTGIKQNDNIYIANASWVQHVVVNTSPETGQAPAGGSQDPLQPVFDFFRRLFGGEAPKPSAHLELVELNPCPEPPMPEAGRLK